MTKTEIVRKLIAILDSWEGENPLLSTDRDILLLYFLALAREAKITQEEETP